jgi:hypothetical protein
MLNLLNKKASGSKVNYEKTKGMYIGSAKNNRPKFTKIVWTKDNAKTLGIHHGYNIQNDEIWKSIIDQMKNCVHVWKSRNLTYYVNHTHASIFYSQAANCHIYLINTLSPDKTPYQSCYFFYVFFWYSPHFNFVATKRDQEIFHY